MQAETSFTQEPVSANELHTTFIRTVSHELRTPLAIVQGYAELLRDGELGNLDPEQQEAVAVITDQAYELGLMVERVGILMALANKQIHREEVALDLLLSEVITAVQPLAERHGITLSFSEPADLPSVMADRYYLHHTLSAIIENGIKFNVKDGHVEVTAFAAGGSVCCQVRDTGIGISETHLAHLFDGFYQAEKLPTRRYEGLGLGLTLAKAVIEACNGRLEVESQLDVGTTVRLWLPEFSAETQHQLQPQKEQHWRILVVDDEERVAQILQAGLEKVPGFEVHVATNGKQALRLLETRVFDLLITDYRMPGMDGLQLAEEARLLAPDISIILITAYNNNELQRQVAQSAIERILNKPVQLAEMRQIAAEILRRQPPAAAGENGQG